MIAGYCSNTVVFMGERWREALQHFNEMPNDSPPFLAIMVYDNALHFDSRWIPPVKDLNEIAEQFDVGYELIYRIPYEQKGEYRYHCLQQQELSPRAAEIRVAINEARTLEKLRLSESRVQEQLHARNLNLHELEVLSHLVGKKYHVFRSRDIRQGTDNAPPEAGRRPWDSEGPGQGKHRSR